MFNVSMVAIMLVAVLTSCKKDSSDDALIVGKWKLSSVSTEEGLTMTVEEIMSDATIRTLLPYADKAEAEMRLDHTFDTVLPNDGSVKKGTWSCRNGNITIKSGYATLKGVYGNNQVSLTYEIESGLLKMVLTGNYSRVVE